jgi:hypothetical protein
MLEHCYNLKSICSHICKGNRIVKSDLLSAFMSTDVFKEYVREHLNDDEYKRLRKRLKLTWR